MRIPAIISIVVILLSGSIIQAQDSEEEPATNSVAVTVYNQGTALIRDRRSFDLEPGRNVLNFTDVAAQIDATSVIFTSISDPSGTIVLEQNYVFDLVNSGALLERYLDETIAVTLAEGQTFTGQLLSGRNNEVILRTEAGEIQVINLSNVLHLDFPQLPDGLITRPTLRWLLESTNGGSQQVELTYLTGGLNWTADYNVLLANGNRSLDINGWVTLNNTSGAAFVDAQLKLVAGDVNRLPSPQAAMPDMMVMEARAMSADTVEQRDFFEYKLYEINRPVTIGMNESKQVEFVTAAGVPARTFYVYDASPMFFGYYDIITDQYYSQTGVTNILNYLEFETGEEDGLGADLPAGRIRVYQEDVDGAALLIGENSIGHTPEGEQVRIYLGNAFDIVGERTQLDYQLISGNVIEETIEIRLRNRKESETVEVRIPERMTRWNNWQILDSSIPYERLDASTIEFRADVPAGEETVITYRVRYSWPR